MIASIANTLAIVLPLTITALLIVTIVSLSILAGTSNRQILPNKHERRLSEARANMAIAEMRKSEKDLELAMAMIDSDIARIRDRTIEQKAIGTAANNS